VALAALAALVRPDTRQRVLGPWAVLALSLGLAALLAGRAFTLAGTGQPVPVWLGFPLLVAQGSAIWAAATAGSGIRGRLSGSSFGWRQPLGLLVAAIAVLSPAAGLAWWAGNGEAGPLDRGPVTSVPRYMADVARAQPDRGTLVVRGSYQAGFDYLVLRDDGQRLGDDSVVAPARKQEPLNTLVGNLVSAATPADVADLADHGVQYVYAPAPADDHLVGNLDGVSGLVSASAVQRGARSWQLKAEPTADDLPAPPDSLRPWLLAGQGLAILAALVLAAPSWRARR
jgi:hypothetical protein